MKSKVLPHILLAVILALAAGFLTIRWLGSVRRGSEAPPTKAVVKKVDIVVAARPIPKGARLDGGMVRMAAYEAALAPAAAQRSLADVDGRVAARDISKDDPITPDKLLPKGVMTAGLPNAVEVGKRAVTVKGSKILGSGGLITPGSRVDVVVTFSVPGKTDAKVGKVLLQDIPVLTTGTEMETRIGKDGKEELASTDLFTLMVTPEQAEQLALAADHGNLHFALRRNGDSGIQTTPGVDFGSMTGTVAAPPGAGAPAGTSSPTYAYQAVRVSAPRAAAQAGGGQAGGGQTGGASSAPAPAVPTAPSAAKNPSSSEARTGLTEEPQGSDQIKVYKIVIEPESGGSSK